MYQYNFYDEPYLKWGAGQATVKQWMSQQNYTILKTAKQDGLDMIYYNPKKMEMSTVLAFDPIFGYKMVIVYVQASEVSYDEMIGYICERYDFMYVSQSDGFAHFCTHDNKTSVEFGQITKSGITAHAIIYSEMQ